MKRPAICLFVWIALASMGAGGQAWAKKGGSGSKAAAPAAGGDAAGDRAAGGASDATAAPADSGQAAPAGGEAAPAEPPAEGGEAALPGEEEGANKPKPPTTLSWQDIVVVPRKAFLKGGRLEMAPFAGVSINDNLIRH